LFKAGRPETLEAGMPLTLQKAPDLRPFIFALYLFTNQLYQLFNVDLS
jgi:hypothetical protein